MIVIDTNVFVGACMGVGASAQVIRHCLSGKFTPAMGSALLMEYEDELQVGQNLFFMASQPAR